MIAIDRNGERRDVDLSTAQADRSVLRADGLPLSLRCPPDDERRVASLLTIDVPDVEMFEADPSFGAPPSERVMDLLVSINGVEWVWLLERELWAPQDLDERLVTLASVTFEGESFTAGTGERLSGWQDLRSYRGPYEDGDTDEIWAEEEPVDLEQECRTFFADSSIWVDQLNPLDWIILSCDRLQLDELRPILDLIPPEALTPETSVLLMGRDGSARLGPGEMIDIIE